MKVLDLFSGIGGFSLGLERAGMETVAFCEFDKKAQLVLKKHWPDVPIYDDVRKLNGRQFEGQSIGIICGGFPCQPFSQAGKRRGEEDDRHLWPEYFRIIQEIRPRWVIGENVAGLINMGLDQVLADLEGENYSCQTVSIPACAINAPHRRDRLWILAQSSSDGLDTQEFRELREDNKKASTRESHAAKTRRHRTLGKNVAYAMQDGLQGSQVSRSDGKDWAQSNDQLATGCGDASGWFLQARPEMGRVSDGVPRRVDRLKQLGNAVVPQIVEIIGRAIMKIERE
jgi:DNA (cytosine-5)-methyltransferase 1